jgi:hypothetical protein
MINQFVMFIALLTALMLANLPWLNDKLFLFITLQKKIGWIRWLEWGVFYLVVLAGGFALESKLMGTISEQDWEFYVVTLCLFIVFALPGFIYCYDLKKILKNRR